MEPLRRAVKLSPALPGQQLTGGPVMSDDGVVKFTSISSSPSELCLRYMAANNLDPQMPVFRAVVTRKFMSKATLDRPEIDKIVTLLFGPFGIVDPRPTQAPFRVAEIQVGDNVLDVEAEYEWENDE